MSFVVGIDAGGTKTVGLLADEGGKILAEARGPGANFQVHEESYVEDVLRQVLAELTAGMLTAEMPGTLDLICIGMAGADRPDDKTGILRVLKRLGVSCPVRIENDALIALTAGSSERKGIVLVAGTGSVAYGVNGHGAIARSGGWGYLLADEGSGFWLGHQALRYSVRAADGRGPATSLVEKVSAKLGLAVPEGLVSWAYNQKSLHYSLSELSLLVAEAADEGDAIARGIALEGARHLARMAESVARQLNLEGEYSLVLSGGVLRGDSVVARHLAEVLELPGARITSLTVEPALGAVRLAVDLL